MPNPKKRNNRKDRKVTDTDRAWYKLGFMAGKAENARKIALLQIANKAVADLFEEEQRLDKDDPVVGVMVPFEDVERIIESLELVKQKNAGVLIYQKVRIRRLKLANRLKVAKQKAGVML